MIRLLAALALGWTRLDEDYVPVRLYSGGILADGTTNTEPVDFLDPPPETTVIGQRYRTPCPVCPHWQELHNPDGSCGCGLNCAALLDVVETAGRVRDYAKAHEPRNRRDFEALDAALDALDRERGVTVGDGLYIGPIQHSIGQCSQEPCACWCAACEGHKAIPSHDGCVLERKELREAARYVVQLGNQPGMDDDEWEQAMTMLEQALSPRGADAAAIAKTYREDSE